MAGPRMTRPLHRRIAVVMDFDGTLASDTVSGLAEALGEPSSHFWPKRVRPLFDQGWDPVLAAFYGLVCLSREQPADRRITRERLQAFGAELQLFDGVLETFDHLRKVVAAIDRSIELEFYCVSSGIREVIVANRVAGHFKSVWACDFHYDESGAIAFPRRVVSHTEKTRYLFQIAKGLSFEESLDKPFWVNSEVPLEELHVPLSQVIYLGDGLTDIPCFGLIHQARGVAIGLFKPSTEEKWGPESGLGRGQRVSNLAPAAYHPGSELVESLELALKSMAYNIRLLEHSVGE